VAINFGIFSALLAAGVGAVDYLGLRLERRTIWIATAHALTNVVAVSLYAASDLVRLSGAALRSGRWWIAVSLSTAGFLILGVGGWLGGKLVHEERVGVIEAPAEDRLAEELGDSAGGRPRRAASAR
jgi:uncharacterized membrane protein